MDPSQTINIQYGSDTDLYIRYHNMSLSYVTRHRQLPAGISTLLTGTLRDKGGDDYGLIGDVTAVALHLWQAKALALVKSTPEQSPLMYIRHENDHGSVTFSTPDISYPGSNAKVIVALQSTLLCGTQKLCRVMMKDIHKGHVADALVDAFTVLMRGAAYRVFQNT